MKRWIGRWLVGVSALHTLLALVVFETQLTSIVARGVFNTVRGDATTGLAVWFMLFGAVLLICGLAVDALEQHSPAVPKSVGWGLLALSALGVCLMPASGFWLALPPAIAILARKSARPSSVAAT